MKKKSILMLLFVAVMSMIMCSCAKQDTQVIHSKKFATHLKDGRVDWTPYDFNLHIKHDALLKALQIKIPDASDVTVTYAERFKPASTDSSEYYYINLKDPNVDMPVTAICIIHFGDECVGCGPACIGYCSCTGTSGGCAQVIGSHAPWGCCFTCEGTTCNNYCDLTVTCGAMVNGE